MLQHRKTCARAAILLASAAMPLGGAHAQTAAVQPAASAGATPTNAGPDAGEIIVTAQKRSQSINKVGMAITSLSGLQLKEQGVASVADLVKIDPSFVFSQAQRGQPVYTIRGIGYNDFSLAATPTVSVYTDEVP